MIAKRFAYRVDNRRYRRAVATRGHSPGFVQRVDSGIRVAVQ